MTDKINHQGQANHRNGLRIGLNLGLVLLAGLIMVGGCARLGLNSTNSTNANTANTNTSPGPGTVVKNSFGMEFAYVPAGSFKMGSEEDGSSYVRPAHQVTIANAFYMGRHEVTKGQWQKVMDDKNISFVDCGENCPHSVKWDEAQEFIKKLNAANDGYTYRFPSEAEWEYACRAGTTGDFAGDPNSMAWYAENADKKQHPVGQKQPNAWGLYDMHGNASEWVMDYFHDNYNGAPGDGSAWVDGGSQKYRTVRGGNFFFSIDYARSYARNYAPPNTYGGFRVVAVPKS